MYFDHIHSLLLLSNSHGLLQALPSYFILPLPQLGAAHMHVDVPAGATSNGHWRWERGEKAIFIILTLFVVVVVRFDSESVNPL